MDRVMQIISLSLAFFVAVTAASDAPIQKQLECLNVTAIEQCNLEVIYLKPVGNLGCDGYIPPWHIAALAYEPRLRVPTAFDNVTDFLIFMVNIDTSIIEGDHETLVYWAAVGKIGDNHKELTITDTLLGYWAPYPPALDAAHRYQIFVFEYDNTPAPGDVIANRRDGVCQFMSNNELAQPLAAFEFKFYSRYYYK